MLEAATLVESLLSRVASELGAFTFVFLGNSRNHLKYSWVNGDHETGYLVCSATGGRLFTGPVVELSGCLDSSGGGSLGLQACESTSSSEILRNVANLPCGRSGIGQVVGRTPWGADSLPVAMYFISSKNNFGNLLRNRRRSPR